MKTKDLILNPFFIVGLAILLLNDFYLKYEFGNLLTGKLSDFAGLLIFPMFIASIIPKLKKWISLVTGLGFIIWKLPLFTPVVDFINQLSVFPIHRVIDYSDYLALLILPLSHYLINYRKSNNFYEWNKIKHISKFALLGMSFFAFCSTSMLRVGVEMPRGTIYIGDSFDIKLPKDSVIKTIKDLGYNCDFHLSDSLGWVDPYYSGSGYKYRDYYQTDNLVHYHYSDSIAPDTIANIKYTLSEIKPNKTKLTIINVTLKKEGHMQDWKELKRLSKEYSRKLKKGLIKEIEEIEKAKKKQGHP